MVRKSFPDGPIVDVLPGAARGTTRGDGNKYVNLGFDDFFYTPITRQNILAVIGKYLGFEPITAPTLGGALQQHLLRHNFSNYSMLQAVASR